MADTPSRKEQTHERIVQAASRAVRRDGFAGVGVAGLMKEAGLTHGGFYAHFESKTQLLAEVAERAGADSATRLARVAAKAPPGQGLQAIVDAYLSDRHVESPETGCPFAALGTEIARQEAPVRAAATRYLKEAVDLLTRQSTDWLNPGDRDTALAAYCSMVGALVLARAVDDPELSRALRSATRHAILPDET